MPLLDRLLRKNPIKLLLGSFGLLDDTQLHVQFGKRKFEERLGQTEHLDQKAGDAKSPIDFLDRFLRAHRIEGRITETQAFSLAQSNINAGSDTTAISLRAIFYYLLKNPRAYDALMTEINEAERNNAFVDVETGLVTWTEAQNLCYLDATIMEALRIHPAVGLCLERVVPPEGATICGKSIPGNIIVGCNTWVINFDEDTFGADAQVFRPERWLEANPDHLALMKKYLFTFGAGSHACIGKNISMLEMYKVVPAVLRRFSVRQTYTRVKSFCLHFAATVEACRTRARVEMREFLVRYAARPACFFRTAISPAQLSHQRVSNHVVIRCSGRVEGRGP